MRDFFCTFEMKIFGLFTVVSTSVVNHGYKDVITLAERYWEENGEKFDATKYLAYGCHCMLLGDKPIGKGVPVDGLDRACRALKQCHKDSCPKFANKKKKPGLGSLVANLKSALKQSTNPVAQRLI